MTSGKIDKVVGIAIVTGASSGIGRASALALCRAGWSCVLSGRRLEALQEVQDQVRAECSDNDAVKTLIVQGDLTQNGQVAALFDKAIETFGRIDVLFNNAGAALEEKEIDAVTMDEFTQLLHLNVTVPFECAKLAYAQMKGQRPQGGRIINNGSVAAQVPRIGSSAYTITKHAMTGLTKSVALDGRAYRIACSQIDIGNANTSLAQRGGGGSSSSGGGGGGRQDNDVGDEAMFDVAHVANTVAYIAGLPLNVNALHTTLLATQMPFVGRG